MTEPEDLEEDLFADLYDAEEATAAAVPPVAAEAPSQLPPSTKTDASETSNSTQPAATQQPQSVQEQILEPSPAHNGAQGGVSAAGDTNSGGQASHESENQGTGIKEDG
ncbi:uncharacterized protein MCYG_04651 [Microsporum canis CBS 113480]|uniref:Uncharacterized protein n=1 Tax=Arthroderma otae (strain ATCC MYA-4605 / CBS 113480) TaxID=554155 RepID=C5FNX9_ARTOC|nr:uncharacterized protein MCYG_04651 [Microsporum canis CBS 113480]EEQ31832.1 predicted protein [Microsporum canis CBS 113480]